MLRTALMIFLVLAPRLTVAEETRADLLGAAAVGRAASWAAQASPCFPRDSDASAEMGRLFAAAEARIRGRPELEAAYQAALMRTSQQQRYIPRSDPTICRQVQEILRRFLAN